MGNESPEYICGLRKLHADFGPRRNPKIILRMDFFFFQLTNWLQHRGTNVCYHNSHWPTSASWHTHAITIHSAWIGMKASLFFLKGPWVISLHISDRKDNSDFILKPVLWMGQSNKTPWLSCDRRVAWCACVCMCVQACNWWVVPGKCTRHVERQVPPQCLDLSPTPLERSAGLAEC